MVDVSVVGVSQCVVLSNIGTIVNVPMVDVIGRAMTLAQAFSI